MSVQLLAAAGWAEGAARSIRDGDSNGWALLGFVVFMASFILVGVLAYVLLQRLAHMVLLSRWQFSMRELVACSIVFALLCAILSFVLKMQSYYS